MNCLSFPPDFDKQSRSRSSEQAHGNKTQSSMDSQDDQRVECGFMKMFVGNFLLKIRYWWICNILEENTPKYDLPKNELSVQQQVKCIYFGKSEPWMNIPKINTDSVLNFQGIGGNFKAAYWTHKSLLHRPNRIVSYEETSEGQREQKYFLGRSHYTVCCENTRWVW